VSKSIHTKGLLDMNHQLSEEQPQDPSVADRPEEEQAHSQPLETRKKGWLQAPYEFDGTEDHKGLMTLITKIVKLFTGGK
jgi:hypothetical protein